MQRQRFRAELALGLRDSFTLLLSTAATDRWAAEPPLGAPLVGQRYVSRCGGRLRSGSVVECIRPVALTLAESLLDPPCHVRLRLRYRLEPAEQGTLVQLEVAQSFNAAASLRKRYWIADIGRECAGLLARLEAAAREDQGARGCSGQKIGSNSMTVVNTISVSGRPSLK